MSARRHVEASAIPADAARSAEVAQRIEQALFEDASLDAHNVLVIVSGDELALRGHVRSWSERSHIGEIAWNTPGVCAVVNDLVLFDDAAVHGRRLHGTDPMDLGAGGCDV
ncbi:BON domain-containing protein [Curtobacterium sp. BH-2-1-1]|uniref:BON domain-containing protein n=1 Tax=Curtobacterium sp. BH-2-1-1 TaxID=1905847 RepID=UPI0009F212F1|nr:BON domain-containing protein [Curtobacterium sp. BH-2-1-1]